MQFVGVKKNPIIIVGQNPGHNYDGTHTGVAWERNKSAKLLWEAIDDRQNLILTNICNYTVITIPRLAEGVLDLYHLIKIDNPSKIVCLGNIAYTEVKKMQVQNMPKVFHFHHPSYIIRFNKGRNSWIKDIRKAIDE